MSVQELFDLSGKTALITGGTGYLGKAMAEALAIAGAQVVISSRRKESAVAAASALPTCDGVGHLGVEMDHMDEESITRGMEEAISAAGQLDVLVNNGNFAVGKDLTSVSGEEFDLTLKNGTGYFLQSRVFRNHIVEREATGSIIMIGSMYGMVGSYPEAYEGVCPSSPVSYHMLKGGILQMTRHLAVYWAKDGVRVNTLSPGPFPSDAAPTEMVERLKEKSPMGRMGKPHELQGALLLLASSAGSYITGQNLVVDGGWTAW